MLYWSPSLMIYSIPKRLEDSILTYVKKTYMPERRVNPKTADEFTNHDVKFFARGIAQMSAYFTSERAHLPKNYLNKKELRAGYLLYFVPSNFLKVIYCLEQAHACERFKDLAQVNILDIGSGPGTASLACAHFWHEHAPDQAVEIVAVDQNTGALHDAKRIVSEFAAPNIRFKTVYSLLNHKNIAKGICSCPPLHYRRAGMYGANPSPINRATTIRGKFHVILAANLISEFRDNEERVLLLKSVTENLLEENGILIVIEPSLRWTTRNLMKVHDNLLESRVTNYKSRVTNYKSQVTSYKSRVIAPCLHSLPCPMLKESARDWCHMYLDWKRPDTIEKLDRLIGNRKDYLKFSYLVIASLPTEGRQAKQSSEHSSSHEIATSSASGGLLAMTNTFRVVSSPMRSKGKTELLLCGQGRLVRVTRLDKNASDKNSDLDHVQRGGLVKYNGPPNIEKTNEFIIKKGTGYFSQKLEK